MCDVLSGGPGMCDKVWQGAGGSKLAKNSVTYFMDGPKPNPNASVLLRSDSWTADIVDIGSHKMALNAKITIVGHL